MLTTAPRILSFFLKGALKVDVIVASMLLKERDILKC